MKHYKCRCGDLVASPHCPNCKEDIALMEYGSGYDDGRAYADSLLAALREIAAISCDHPSGVPCHREIAKAALTAKAEE